MSNIGNIIPIPAGNGYFYGIADQLDTTYTIKAGIGINTNIGFYAISSGGIAGLQSYKGKAILIGNDFTNTGGGGGGEGGYADGTIPLSNANPISIIISANGAVTITGLGLNVTCNPGQAGNLRFGGAGGTATGIGATNLITGSNGTNGTVSSGVSIFPSLTLATTSGLGGTSLQNFTIGTTNFTIGNTITTGAGVNGTGNTLTISVNTSGTVPNPAVSGPYVVLSFPPFIPPPKPIMAPPCICFQGKVNKNSSNTNYSNISNALRKAQVARTPSSQGKTRFGN
jgi:hypothetical protein